MAHTCILRRQATVQVLHARRKIQSGVDIRHLRRDADIHTSDGVNHVDQPTKINHHEVLDVQAAQVVHLIQGAAGGRGHVAALRVAIGKDGVEHYRRLRGDLAVSGLAARSGDHEIARYRYQIHALTVCGDLQNHRGIGIMQILDVAAATADYGITRTITRILTNQQNVDYLIGIRIHR